MSRCGIVALAGEPNAGKSTLLNALVGERLAITSPKPQTTRVPVHGLLTDGDTQVLFVDPAGLITPAYPLQRAMRRAAVAVLEEADVILHVHPLAQHPAPPLEALLPDARALPGCRFRAYSKADLVPAAARPALDGDALAVSAVTGEGVAALRDRVRLALPEGPFLYDPEDVGTQPLRFFAAEFVREAAFAELRQELPYAVAVQIDAYREEETGVYIRATLAVERESQKPIVLGKGGRTIKAVGTAARERLAAFLGRRVHLDLWVTVWPKWRSDPTRLAQLGLPTPKEKGS
ncbi:MAG TPA: GTPase Era [Gemmatimonadales bacterium]|nr:GTPase Era [Gemmatimonadales bacterium]